MSSGGPVVFSPTWARPERRRRADAVAETEEEGGGREEASASSVSSSGSPATAANDVLRRNYPAFPCLVCGVSPPPPPPSPVQEAAGDGRPSDKKGAGQHKKCSKCHAATYCGVKCQRVDYASTRKGGGEHRKYCGMLATLWDEKAELEETLWGWTGEATAVDDHNDDGASNDDGGGGGENTGANMPIVGQFWSDRPSTEIEKTTTQYCVALLNLMQILGRDEGSWRALKARYTLLRNDDDDDDDDDRSEQVRGRVRPSNNPLAQSLAIEIGLDLLYLDRSDMRCRTFIPSLYIELGRLQEAYDYVKYWLQPKTTDMIMGLMTMDLSVAEVMELPYLDDAKFQCENMEERLESWIDFNLVYPSLGMVFDLALIKLKMANVARRTDGREERVEELNRQAVLLLSAVHKLNPNLLPHLGGGGGRRVKDENLYYEPMAVNELLDVQRPGFEMQCRMGNPGGRSKDEAVTMWQHSMAVWTRDGDAGRFLSDFCSDLEGNIVQLPPSKHIDDDDGRKREEAEVLVARLQRENPDLSADGIMMHPEMALLMATHLQQSNSYYR